MIGIFNGGFLHEDIGKVFTNFLLEKLTFAEMTKAFHRTEGRTISI